MIDTAAPLHDAAGLTRYIETRYHARHRQQLPLLAKMAEMVEDLHRDEDDMPRGLFAILQRMIDAMEARMEKEELILFPAIRAGGGPGIEDPIAVMRGDHDDQDREIAAIRRLTHELTVPAGACSPWITLYKGLAELIDDLTEHMRLEKEALFRRSEGAAREPAATRSASANPERSQP